MAITTSDALWLLDLLRGLEATVGGGWGVDALWGTQTRVHADFDLYLPAFHLDTATTRLRRAAFKDDVDWLPGRLAMIDDTGRAVDLHPYEPRLDGSGLYTTHTGDTLVFPASAFVAGTIGEQAVPCWSVEFQLAAHTGYEPSASDLHDLELLAQLAAK